jgi:hypothetical protein
MNWFKRFLQKTSDRFQRWINPPYRTQVVDDVLPKTLQRKILYVVQDDGFLEQAAMVCPCGCGRTLHMNLLSDERPVWNLTQHNDGTATLHPSVWRQKDCGSHFWFRHGRVTWCTASTE